MVKEEIRKRIFMVIRETFGAHLIADNMTIEGDLIPDNWDKIMFMINLESMFNIGIPEEDEDNLMRHPVKEITKYIEERLQEKE
jgi:acyl carrier protein